MKCSGQTNPCPKHGAKRSASLDLLAEWNHFLANWIPAGDFFASFCIQGKKKVKHGMS